MRGVWNLSSSRYLEVPIEWGVVIGMCYCILPMQVFGRDERHYLYIKSLNYCVLSFCLYGSAIFISIAIDRESNFLNRLEVQKLSDGTYCWTN